MAGSLAGPSPEEAAGGVGESSAVASDARALIGWGWVVEGCTQIRAHTNAVDGVHCERVAGGGQQRQRVEASAGRARIAHELPPDRWLACPHRCLHGCHDSVAQDCRTTAVGRTPAHVNDASVVARDLELTRRPCVEAQRCALGMARKGAGYGA